VSVLPNTGALVVAPHPFYPIGLGMGDTLVRYPRIFDAVEFSGMYSTAPIHDT